MKWHKSLVKAVTIKIQPCSIVILNNNFLMVKYISVVFQKDVEVELLLFCTELFNF
jgi:hypothetical protein